jgi:hypothetical protein
MLKRMRTQERDAPLLTTDPKYILLPEKRLVAVLYNVVSDLAKSCGDTA